MNKTHKYIYPQEQKESWRVGKNSWKELWKFQGNERNFGSIFQVKYIYVYIKFLMYEFLLWELKLLFTIFIFAIKVKLSKNYKKCFLFYQKSFFHIRDFQIFTLPSSPLFFPGNCWFYRRSWLMKNFKVYGIIMSLNSILKT